MPARKTKTPASGRKRKQSSRLSKEQWLDKSMQLLAKRGPAAMTLDSLTRHLGVTTGSFYWHFKSHGQFLEELTDRWIRDFTHVVGDRLATLDLPPIELLRAATRQIIELGLGGLDIHFRALAISYPALRKKILATDKYRTALITGLFEDLGYTGDELRIRVHTFVVLHSLESGITTNLPPEQRLQLLDERLRLLAGDLSPVAPPQ